MRLWRTAGKYDAGQASVGRYLYVIADSVAADLRNGPSSWPLLPVEDADIPPRPDSLDQIIDRVIGWEAVGTLSPAHAEVIRRAHEEGLAQSQIAERLNLPLGTVKTRHYHAMRALRTALIERGFHDV